MLFLYSADLFQISFRNTIDVQGVLPTPKLLSTKIDSTILFPQVWKEVCGEQSKAIMTLLFPWYT